MPITTAYWNIRGIGETLRLLLEYTGQQYEDKRYQLLGPPWDRSQWLNDRDNLGLDFPNLPYVIDGDVRITQAFGCLRYIAGKYQPELLGAGAEEQARIAMMEHEALDFRNASVKVYYTGADGFEAAKEGYLKFVLPKFFGRLEKYLTKEGNQWAGGANLSYVDFYLAEHLDQSREFAPDLVAAYPTVVAYMDRFLALPAIAAYRSSGRYKRGPINNLVATWGVETEGEGGKFLHPAPPAATPPAAPASGL